VSGLARGDLLLPPTLTGAVSTADCSPTDAGRGTSPRRDRVYLARQATDATVYAGLQLGGGDVYEVEPVGEIEPGTNDGSAGAHSACVAAARVVRVVWRDVTPDVALAAMRTFAAELERPV
jgi:hypothetical protein